MCKTTTRTAAPNPALLGDLRLLVDETSLVFEVERAVDAVTSQLPPLVGSPALPGIKRLLGLLTYSYSVGAFATDDIYRLTQFDRAAKYFIGDLVVEPEVLRAFRRANRPWIEACLAQVIGQLAAAADTASACEILSPHLSDLPSDTPALQLARRRVELATLLDMALAD